MAPRRTTWVSAAVGLAVATALWMWIEHSRAPAAVAPAIQAIPAEIDVAKRADVPLYLQGLGTVQAFDTVTVTTRVDGELQNIKFRDGQDVKAGDILAQIDPRPYQAVYEQAVATKAKDRATLANAKLDLQRYQTLASQNAIATQMLDTQRATVAQLQAQVEVDQGAIDSAKTNLDYTTIRSPITGRVGIRQITMGNNLTTSANTAIVVVTQMQPINVLFTLPEEDLAEVTAGLKVGSLQAAALSRDNKTELDRGNIVVLDDEVNQTSGTLMLKATFPNAAEKLWPGDFVNVKLLVRIEKQALTVPAAAVQRGPGAQYVYVVKPDATVALRSITLESVASGVAAIKSGLEPGEVVVTAGQYRLQAGAHLQLSKAQLADLRFHSARRPGPK